MARIVIIGLGNVLLGDEALGPQAAKLLESRWEFPDDVAVHEIGTQGLDLTSWVQGSEALIVIASIHAQGLPGEIRVLDRHAILARDPAVGMSPHAFGIADLLLTLEFSGGAPREAWVVGAIPEHAGLRTGLTPTLEAALPLVVDRVLAMLQRLGAEPRPRSTPLAADVWWSRDA